MDYMDLAVRCSRKAVKLNHSLTCLVELEFHLVVLLRFILIQSALCYSDLFGSRKYISSCFWTWYVAKYPWVLIGWHSYFEFWALCSEHLLLMIIDGCHLKRFKLSRMCVSSIHSHEFHYEYPGFPRVGDLKQVSFSHQTGHFSSCNW